MGLVDTLLQRCSLQRCPKLSSCPRRTEWDDTKPGWPAVRGNAFMFVLVAAGAAAFHSVTGHEHFRVDDNLLTFRAGPWKDWWNEDIRWEASQLGLPGAIVLWENNRLLTVVELDVWLGVLNPDEPLRIGDPPRLRKDHPRSAQCWHCPIREKCDGWDEVHNTTDDWPKGWIK